MEKPLIITLHLEEKAKKYFTDQRTAYFPAHINWLDAHLTLFHALPSDEKIIPEIIRSVCKRDLIDLDITGLHNIGNGVVYKIDSAELKKLHAFLQHSFQSFLIGKDKQELWPHITIQNKVTAFKAKTLFEELSAGFSPFKIKATGISTFLYEDGPWTQLHDYQFQP